MDACALVCVTLANASDTRCPTFSVFPYARGENTDGNARKIYKYMHCIHMLGLIYFVINEGIFVTSVTRNKKRKSKRDFMSFV